MISNDIITFLYIQLFYIQNTKSWTIIIHHIKTISTNEGALFEIAFLNYPNRVWILIKTETIKCILKIEILRILSNYQSNHSSSYLLTDFDQFHENKETDNP
jgi:hypothetical protein